MGDNSEMSTAAPVARNAPASINISPSSAGTKQEPSRIRRSKFVHYCFNASTEVKHTWPRFKTKSQDLWKGWYINGWLFECVNLCISLGTLLGVVAVFTKYNGTDVDEWPYKISLNTLVVILTIISNGCLGLVISSSISQIRWIYYRKLRRLRDFQTLDSASRGVLGSLETLARIRDPLAVAGATILLLALGFETFTQQAISVAAAPNFLPTLLDLSLRDLSEAPDLYATVTRGLVSAAIQSIVDNNLDQQDFVYPGDPYEYMPTGYQVTCSGFFCENFQTYVTLNLSHRCQNITDDLKVSCESGSNSCVLELPSGLSLANSTQRAVMSSTNSTNKGRGETKPNIVADFELISSTPYTTPTYGVGTPSELSDAAFVAAHSCQISLCATIYTMWDEEGELGEMAVKQTCDLAPLTGNADIQLRFPSGTLSPGAYQLLPENDKYDNGADVESLLLGKINLQSHLIADNSSISYLRDLFSSMWTGSVPRNPPSPSPAVYFQDQGGADFWNTLALAAFNATYFPEYEQDFGCQYCQYDRLDDYLRTITYNMTKWLRSFFGESVLFSHAKSLVPYYDVQWPWLIFPFVVQFAATVFFLIVALVSHKVKAPVWKDSALAILGHGVSHEIIEEMVATRDVGEMDELSKVRKVRLAPTPKGIQLVSNDQNIRLDETSDKVV